MSCDDRNSVCTTACRFACQVNLRPNGCTCVPNNSLAFRHTLLTHSKSHTLHTHVHTLNTHTHAHAPKTTTQKHTHVNNGHRRGYRTKHAKRVRTRRDSARGLGHTRDTDENDFHRRTFRIELRCVGDRRTVYEPLYTATLARYPSAVVV